MDKGMYWMADLGQHASASYPPAYDGPDEHLPGETFVDPALVESAVNELNRIYNQRGLDTARKLGQYLLETFFDDQPTLYASSCRTHVSFRALAARPDLAMSHTTLSTSVAVVEQLRLLPEWLGERLALSHHKALLPIHDPAVKVHLAKIAVTRNLSSREFRLLVAQYRDTETDARPAGRPALPPVVKAMRRLERVIELATAEPLDSAKLARLDPEKVEELVDATEIRLGELLQVVGRLRDILAASRASLPQVGSDR